MILFYDQLLPLLAFGKDMLTQQTNLFFEVPPGRYLQSPLLFFFNFCFRKNFWGSKWSLKKQKSQQKGLPASNFLTCLKVSYFCHFLHLGIIAFFSQSGSDCKHFLQISKTQFCSKIVQHLNILVLFIILFKTNSYVSYCQLLLREKTTVHPWDFS